MALATYADLTAAIATWLNRSDYTAIIPDFIRLAEVEFDRILRDPDMEKRATATLTGNALALPTGFQEMRSLKVDGTDLVQVVAADFFALEPETVGVPAVYTIADGQLFFNPATSASATVTMTYFEAIPALTASNTTNWLMTRAPDLYLFASLAQAEFYGWNDDRLPLVKARVDEILAQMGISGERRMYGSAKLAPRLGFRA